MKSFNFNNEIDTCAEIEIDWTKIDNKTLMITGATGMVGKYLIKVLMRRNQMQGVNTKVIAVGRNEENFRKRFADVADVESITFLQHDVQMPCTYEGRLDYIIHMASNTHPWLYATDPIGTEMINIFGSYYLLDLASKNQGCRFVFTSSGDIYGDNRSDMEYIGETDCGYIDCNTLRAGYIEGKRASEALCNAFKESKGVDFVIPRLCRIYGPTINLADSKAITQFIKKAIAKEDIVLKSKGTQTFSYLYIHDVVSALLMIMAQGNCGEAYNIAEEHSDIMLKDLAAIIAEMSGKKVVFEIPDAIEAAGYSKATKARLDGRKLAELGWKPMYDIKSGILRTVKILQQICL